MKCNLCNEEQTVRSMAMHLKWNHQLKTEDYIKQYGEFRPNFIKQDTIKQTSNIKCEECQKPMMHHRQLLYHLTKEHKNISQEQYIVNHYFNGINPICKCGCGQNTEFIRSGKNDKGDNAFFRDYIKGHWDWVKPGWIEHSYDTKMKMREIKIEQIKQNPNYYEKISEAELELVDFIKQYVDIETSNRTILHGKELDIFIPSLSIAIEFNGCHFHSDLFKEKQYHLKKTKECKLQGIRLIHIWESDWYSKKDIIKSNLLNIIGKTQTRIFARKCILKEVSHKESSIFLENNHIQGTALSKINLGLYYNDELVSLITFSKIRKNLGGKSINNHYELLRFCNKINTSVVGGASKLFKYFIKNYNPLKIITYANRDWSNGNLYYKLNMNFLKFTDVGYSYFKSKIKYNRFSFRKDILIKEGYDPNKTEYEIMKERGFYRCWNTGNLKFEWSPIF